MADDIAVTEGAGKTVATDEVSSRHFQLIKPAFGPDGAATMVSSANPMPVDGGAAHIVRVAPTVTAGSYSADACMGGEMVITDAARNSGGGGVLCGITAAIEDDASDGFAGSDVEVMIFDRNPAGTYTDGAALDSSSLTDADAATLLGSVLLDQKSALGNITLLKATNVNLMYVCSGSANLYAVAINRGAKTPEATDAVTFTFHLIRG